MIKKQTHSTIKMCNKTQLGTFSPVMLRTDEWTIVDTIPPWFKAQYSSCHLQTRLKNPAMQLSLNPRGKKRHEQMKRAHRFKTELKMLFPSLQGAAGVSLERNRDQLAHLSK